jgi:hypothetical protein
MLVCLGEMRDVDSNLTMEDGMGLLDTSILFDLNRGILFVI